MKSILGVGGRSLRFEWSEYLPYASPANFPFNLERVTDLENNSEKNSCLHSNVEILLPGANM